MEISDHILYETITIINAVGSAITALITLYSFAKYKTHKIFWILGFLNMNTCLTIFIAQLTPAVQIKYAMWFFKLAATGMWIGALLFALIIQRFSITKKL